MTDYPAGSIEKNGQSYPIVVDSWGAWKTTENFGGQTLRADTRDALAEKIGRAVKTTSVKVSVPFCTPYKGELRSGTATGIHATNGNVLVTWSNGTKEQLRAVYQDTFLTELDDAQAAEYLRLQRAKWDAQIEFEDFERPFRVRLDDAVKAAISEAQES